MKLCSPCGGKHGRSVKRTTPCYAEAGVAQKDPPMHIWKYPNRVRHWCPSTGHNPIRATCPEGARGPEDPARGKACREKRGPTRHMIRSYQG